MAMLASEALAIMNTWDKNAAIDIMLSRISKIYKAKSHSVTEWASDLTENRIWRGGNDSSRRKVRVPRRASPRKAKSKSPKRNSPSRKSPNALCGTTTPTKVWTKGQREEAAKRKADEADAAALCGVRKSRR